MSPGILRTVGLAATVAFAVPLALMGADWLLAGRPVGAVFIAMAVLMVVVEEYLLTPSDLPVAAAERLAGRVAEEPDEE